jgi:hypothetical protein
MDMLSIRVNKVKNLIDLCSQNSITTAITADDIDSLLTEDISVAEKLRRIELISRDLHELLYAPPRR